MEKGSRDQRTKRALTSSHLEDHINEAAGKYADQQKLAAGATLNSLLKEFDLGSIAPDPEGDPAELVVKLNEHECKAETKLALEGLLEDLLCIIHSIAFQKEAARIAQNLVAQAAA